MVVKSVITGWSMDKSTNSEHTEPGGSSLTDLAEGH